jgi:hypothetical protein
MVFQGDFETLKAWFGIEDLLKLYHALAKKPLGEWFVKWGGAAQESCVPGDANLRICSASEPAAAAAQESCDPGDTNLRICFASESVAAEAQESCDPGMQIFVFAPCRS